MGTYSLLCCLIFAACTGFSLETPIACGEVSKVFKSRNTGPDKSLPEATKTGSDLQLCATRNLTCCTRRMEERYQAAVLGDAPDLVQAASFSLKLLISQSVATFQEMFESLMKQAEDETNALFLSTYRDMAADSAPPVRRLFADVARLVLGGELASDDLVGCFFDNLFPVVYNHLLNPGLSDITANYAWCVRQARRRLGPFGRAPGQLAERLGRSARHARVFLQALNLGVEVVNTTDHLSYTGECRRALLRMLHCPRCQGLGRAGPCTGYCLNVMRGCLVGAGRVDRHWREFVRSLEEESDRMQGPRSLEQGMLGVHQLVNDAVAHAQRNGPRLSAQVHRVCGHPDRKPAQPGVDQGDNGRYTVPPKTPERGNEDNFSSRRKEIIDSLRPYRTFYGGLADQLCVHKLAVGDRPSCWNGADMVESYTLQVVANGMEAQEENPEVRVKGEDPVINQIIDKLKHVNQLLQGKSIPKLGTLDLIETGSGEPEGRFSGDCDDEDGCGGSGDDEANRASQWTPDEPKDHRRHKPQTDLEMTDTSCARGLAKTSLSTLSLVSSLLLQW